MSERWDMWNSLQVIWMASNAEGLDVELREMASYSQL